MSSLACDESLIADYLDDCLSPQRESLLEDHLDHCDSCRVRMTEFAGSGDDWTAISQALRNDELDTDSEESSWQPAWPLKLLGPTDDPRMLGRIGPFEVSACVGVGGMGVVFKARDPALDRFVAVKVLAPHLAASESARSRFAREAKAAAAVVHDNVIAVHQVSEYQGLPYLVMPYLPGPSLEDRLLRDGRLAPAEALRIARQVADGLQAAHAQGLIHRDIKPANIMLSGETERAVITDFGLARAADDATLTQSGTLAGTPQFMAPEQARGERTDEQSDLFSLGAVLFTMLSGQPPVPTLSGSETIRQVGHVAPPLLSGVVATASDTTSAVLSSLHAFEPSHRYQTAAEAEAALSAALRQAGAEKLELRATAAVQPKKQRRRRAIVVAVSMLALGFTVWPHLFGTAEPQREITPHIPSEIDTSQPAPVTSSQILAMPSREMEGPRQVAVSTPQLADPPPTPSPVPEDVAGQEIDALLRHIEITLDQLENR